MANGCLGLLQAGGGKLLCSGDRAASRAPRAGECSSVLECHGCAAVPGMARPGRVKAELIAALGSSRSVSGKAPV